MYLYIHGFLSSSQSAKAQQFKHWLASNGREKEWKCPDLPADPKAAIQLLSNIIDANTQPLKLVGSSLGGFYATALAEQFSLKAVLINPAVRPSVLLQQKIGMHKAWHSDVQVVFSQTHVDILKQIEVNRIAKPDNIFLMIEKGDETLDYRQALTLYENCHQLIFNGGNHSFSRFDQVLGLIDAF